MNYKYIVSMLALCSTLTLHSQELPYTLQTIEGFGYTPLTNADTLDTNGPWDDPVLSIPIGFNFQLFGQTIDTLFLNGFVGAYIMSDETQSPMAIPYGADLTDRGFGTSTSQSPILYKIDGQAPWRILKMEWQNAGFYNEQSLGIDESFVNFQIWLYESFETIEFCYGPSNIVLENNLFFVPTRSAPAIGLADEAAWAVTGGFLWLLQDDPLDPEITLYENFNVSNTVLDSTPPANTIYRFRVADPSAVNEEDLAVGVEIYPNPASKELRLDMDFEEAPDHLEVRIFNALGQAVYYQDLGQQMQSNTTIDIEHLPSGVYNIQVRDGAAQHTKQFMKT